MMKRLLTGSVAALAAVAAILLLDGTWIFVILLLLFEGSAWELSRIGKRLYPRAPIEVLLLLIPVAAFSWLSPPSYFPALPFAVLAASPLVLAVLLLSRGANPTEALGALGFLSFGLVYLSAPFWSLFELHRASPRLLLLLLITVWGNDAAAFWVGSAVGRRKLAPRLSPNKTYEGSVAGLVAAALLAFAGLTWLGAENRWELWALLVLTSVAAQLGDLIESLLKRAAAIKDSGRILPGHGGLLDRLDAIILAAPVFYGLLGLFSTGVDF